MNNVEPSTTKPKGKDGSQMETSTNQIFPPLESLTRPTVPTKQAAFYLDRKPQTMRAWSCLNNGAIRPLRVNGRLAWSVKEIKKVLGVEV